MNKILSILLIFLLLILQIAFMPHLAIFGVFPDILLAAIIFFAVLKGGELVFLFAFFSGLALDVFSSRAFGIYALNFVLVTWLIQFIGKNVFKATDFSGQISIIACACSLFSILNLFLIKNFYWLGLGQNISFWSNFLRVGLLEIILNFALAVLGLAIFKKVYAQLYNLDL